ncbi:MAG: hypothetical protein ACLVB5_09080 [Christensenellales bacterium]
MLRSRPCPLVLSVSGMLQLRISPADIIVAGRLCRFPRAMACRRDDLHSTIPLGRSLLVAG